MKEGCGRNKDENIGHAKALNEAGISSMRK
jgi:hypothetical protein